MQIEDLTPAVEKMFKLWNYVYELEKKGESAELKRAKLELNSLEFYIHKEMGIL